MADPRDFGALTFLPAADHPELLGAPVVTALPALDFQVGVAAIDATLSDTAAFCEAYDVPAAASANCVVVTGKREGEERWAAVVVLATTRADVNGAVRRRVDVRKISFAPQDTAVELSGMEYGGITPIGLPADWPVLVDRAVVEAGPVIIGAGIRGAKILVEGADLARLPGAEVIEDLARPIP